LGREGPKALQPKHPWLFKEKAYQNHGANNVATGCKGEKSIFQSSHKGRSYRHLIYGTVQTLELEMPSIPSKQT